MMCFGVKDRKRLNTNHCVIVLLDDTQLVHELHASSTGQDLLDVVIKHLNLLETSYFGLKYLDQETLNDEKQEKADERGKNRRVTQLWLDMEKSAIKQLKSIHPMTVYFGVKYYAADPCKLAEEITRYQFFLQCKQDILHSRLPVTFELAVELFALAVQSELGDFDPQRQEDDESYVSEFQFLPNQSLELEKRVAQFHRTLVGQVPATAELNFLERVKWLDLYGCELHSIEYEDDTTCDDYALGLNPSGILVLRNKLMVAQYVWPRILKTKCQGRCLLVDVYETGGGAKEKDEPSSRFGFRLHDKAASRRLRQAIEEHKSFHYLIHSSATLQQLAQRQHQQLQFQQMKLSQRFRHSIRSAINVANLKHSTHLIEGGGQHKLRSSVKSLANQQLQMMQQYALDNRAPPTVVRTPSRRYGSAKNRSLKLTNAAPPVHGTSANHSSNDVLPNAPHTMSESQRQQALMMMSGFIGNGGAVGKSQTLKPISSSAKHGQPKDVQKNNPYYHMMMMMMAAQAQAQAQVQQPGVQVPQSGRHLAHPNNYKQQQQSTPVNIRSSTNEQSQLDMQFYHTGQTQYPPGSTMLHRIGRESPKSIKSAHGPVSSSALKLSGKKVAKQHSLINSLGNTNQQHQFRADLPPLLAPVNSTIHTRQKPAYPNQYYEVYRDIESNSTSVSPRSSRSAKIAGKHKSKSTIENLNLLHVKESSVRRYPGVQPVLKNSNSNKMLLATTTQLQLQAPLSPSPCYNSSQVQNYSTTNSSRGPSNNSIPIKRIPANVHSNVKEKSNEYCCSRSDCSSEDDSPANQASIKSSVASNKNISNRKRRSQLAAKSKENLPQVSANDTDELKDWNAIRKRHSEFLLNGSFGGQLRDIQKIQQSNISSSSSSSLGHQQQLIKNIPNKQATPILLSMNYEQNNSNNNRAIQLLNLQRQQLNNQISDACKSSSSIINSASSSLASSPQASNGSGQPLHSHKKKTDLKVAGSTASSSSTSGYYAGSNSISESASAESDSQITTIEGMGRPFSSRQQVPATKREWSNGKQLTSANRARLLHENSYNMLASENLDENQQYVRSTLLSNQQSHKTGVRQHKLQQHYYLDESKNQIQQTPSKYVSFDV